jgi:SAM-dependent methyltransferase
MYFRKKLLKLLFLFFGLFFCDINSSYASHDISSLNSQIKEVLKYIEKLKENNKKVFLVIGDGPLKKNIYKNFDEKYIFLHNHDGLKIDNRSLIADFNNAKYLDVLRNSLKEKIDAIYIDNSAFKANQWSNHHILQFKEILKKGGTFSYLVNNPQNVIYFVNKNEFTYEDLEKFFKKKYQNISGYNRKALDTISFCPLYLGGELGGKVKGKLKGIVNGELKGKVNGKIKGKINGELRGKLSGELKGEVEGRIRGTLKSKSKNDGNLKMSLDGDLRGKLKGAINGELQGLIETHRIEGHLNGELNGELKGIFEGSFDGEMDGLFKGEFSGQFEPDSNSNPEKMKERFEGLLTIKKDNKNLSSMKFSNIFFKKHVIKNIHIPFLEKIFGKSNVLFDETKGLPFITHGEMENKGVVVAVKKNFTVHSVKVNEDLKVKEFSQAIEKLEDMGFKIKPYILRQIVINGYKDINDAINQYIDIYKKNENIEDIVF